MSCFHEIERCRLDLETIQPSPSVVEPDCCFFTVKGCAFMNWLLKIFCIVYILYVFMRTIFDAFILFVERNLILAKETSPAIRLNIRHFLHTSLTLPCYYAVVLMMVMFWHGCVLR